MAESDWLMEIGSCEDHTSALYQDLMRRDESDKRSIALARTYLEIGFMWMRRGALRRHNNVWEDDRLPLPEVEEQPQLVVASSLNDTPLHYVHTQGPITAFQLVCPNKSCGWAWPESEEPADDTDLNCSECGETWAYSRSAVD